MEDYLVGPINELLIPERIGSIEDWSYAASWWDGNNFLTNASECNWGYEDGYGSYYEAVLCGEDNQTVEGLDLSKFWCFLLFSVSICSSSLCL